MEDQQPRQQLARTVSAAEQRIVASAAHLPEADRRALLEWARALLGIRGGDGSALRKAREALSLDGAAAVLGPVVRSTGRMLGDVAWNDRSWSERLGVGAVALAGAAVAGQGAAVAAVGAAVGVPLWIVLGAGDGFAVALRDELERSLAAAPPPTVITEDGPVVDADWEFAEGEGPDRASSAGGAKEPLWTVFRRAYRDARARQKSDVEW
jgi:hypothetical protein